MNRNHFLPEEIEVLAKEWLVWFAQLDRLATKEEIIEGMMRGAITKDYCEGYIKALNQRPLSPSSHGGRDAGLQEET